MTKILVTYATMAGSTAEVAQAVGDEIARSGIEAKVLPLREVETIEGYDGVVVGGPMILGWHREAARFLKRHRKTLQRIPFAVFIMGMSLTQTSDSIVSGVPVYVDENLPKPPEKEGSLSFRERYTRLSNYLKPIFKAPHPAKPTCVGVFGGRMEYGRLKWWAVLFAMLIIQTPAGDRRNWEAIRSWATGLPDVFRTSETSTN